MSWLEGTEAPNKYKLLARVSVGTESWTHENVEQISSIFKVTSLESRMQPLKRYKWPQLGISKGHLQELGWTKVCFGLPKAVVEDLLHTGTSIFHDALCNLWLLTRPTLAQHKANKGLTPRYIYIYMYVGCNVGHWVAKRPLIMRLVQTYSATLFWFNGLLLYWFWGS